jgi:hypothetical protein
MKLKRAIEEPVRDFVDMDHRWRGPDKGLIWCWESGRLLAQEEPELARSARSGELVVLVWKGGFSSALKQKRKPGTLQYLAQWQGLSGLDLDLDMEGARTITCSKTGMQVTFSAAHIDDDDFETASESLAT